MKGIIFNITEKFITEKFGEEVYDEILESCDLETKDPFVSAGTYSDSDLMEMLAKSTQILKMDLNSLLVNLGHYSFAKLSEKYMHFVTPYKHPKDFLKTVEGVIHVEVRKLYQGTQLPTFQYHEPSEDELVITYYSTRKLYPFMEGLINGVSDHFEVPVTQKHSIYTKDGHEFCDFHLKF